MQKYNCDVCNDHQDGGEYYGYNSWYGYCSESCKVVARNKELERHTENALHDIENGNIPDYEELLALI
jgi:hypothetical protein